MIIKVLGPGCSKCKLTEKHVKKAIQQLKREDITVKKVENLEEIMKYDVLSTPAVVIDEEVKILGKVATVKEIIDLLEK